MRAPDKTGFKDKLKATAPAGLRKTVSRAFRNIKYGCRLLRTLNVNPPWDPVVQCRFDPPTLDPAPFFVGTQSGLLLVKGRRTVRLMGGSVYGIAPGPVNDDWYVFQRIPGSFGRLVTYCPGNGGVRGLAGFLSTGIHQIDWIRGRLAVVDTYNNRILFYDRTGRRTGSAHPEGKLENGRSSVNYRHFNSVFSPGDKVLLVAHNQTVKSGRKSQIYELDSAWNNVRTIPTRSGSAHNVALIGGGLWHCDSNGGGLVVGGDTVFQAPGLFTRGLAVNGSHILIGGSTLAEREHRTATDGLVVVLNRRFEEEGRVLLEGSGGVQEIRFLENDLCLSRNGSGVS